MKILFLILVGFEISQLRKRLYSIGTDGLVDNLFSETKLAHRQMKIIFYKNYSSIAERDEGSIKTNTDLNDGVLLLGSLVCGISTFASGK